LPPFKYLPAIEADVPPVIGGEQNYLPFALQFQAKRIIATAAALGADQPLAPIEDRGPRTVASSHLGGIGLGLMVAFPAPPRSA
jgi:hypothetical protein